MPRQNKRIPKSASGEDRVLESLLQMTGMAEAAEAAGRGATLAPVIQTVDTVQEILDRWRGSGAPLLFQGDAELARYHRATMERILISLVNGLSIALEKLVLRVQQPKAEGEDWTIHDLLRIVESLGNQVANLRPKTEKTSPGKLRAEDFADTAELDQELRALEDAAKSRGLLVEVTADPPPPEELP